MQCTCWKKRRGKRKAKRRAKTKTKNTKSAARAEVKAAKGLVLEAEKAGSTADLEVGQVGVGQVDHQAEVDQGIGGTNAAAAEATRRASETREVEAEREEGEAEAES